MAEPLALPRGAVHLAPAPPAARHALRGRPETLARAAQALGLRVPETCRAVRDGDRALLWLGPDEFLLLQPPGIAAAGLAALAVDPVIAVDISQRQAGLILSGNDAASLLNAGCPLDLDPAPFPVGACTRTLLGRTEVVLWRAAPETFHLEVARSFLPYAVAFLREAAHGLD
jgi:sarcosine oxidase subunit gamma